MQIARPRANAFVAALRKASPAGGVLFSEQS